MNVLDLRLPETGCSLGARLRRLAVSMILPAFALAIPATAHATQSRTTTFEVFVNAGTGDDANDGTLGQPLRTLNRALLLAWRARHPKVGTGVTSGSIKVLYSAMPIAPGPTVEAPAGFGGVEPAGGGWRTDTERAAGCFRAPFPIRMVDGIDLIGVESNGRKPVITVDEIAAGVAYASWTPQGTCNPFGVQAAVLAASQARLEGFVIRGDKLVDSSKSRFPGLRVTSVQGAEIADCDIFGWHDQVDIDPVVESLSASVDFLDCTLSDSWPINIGGGSDYGHAAMWIRGPGDCNVTLDGCTIARSHDAIEVAVEGSRANVIVRNCKIVDNENGFEVVGNGKVTLRIEDCEFTDNYNRPVGGTPTSTGLVAALAFRGTVLVACKVRRCTFRNNTASVLWQVQAPSVLDLGSRDTDPGLNTFCLDYCLFPPGADVYGACIVQRNSPSMEAPGVIFARGNAWLPYTQGASGPRGRQMSGRMQGIVEPVVPFPGFGCATDGTQYPRQYSSQHENAIILFDQKNMLPPIWAPDCASCVDADCP